MNEVFIAKNGRPYVKDENGKVRFISSTEWKEYESKKASSNSGKWFMLAFVVTGVIIYLANNIGDLL